MRATLIRKPRWTTTPVSSLKKALTVRATAWLVKIAKAPVVAVLKSTNVESVAETEQHALDATNPAAPNFDPTATVDDGTCETPACLGDLNLDSIISVADILVMLGDFGCNSLCVADLNDDSVESSDLLIMLTVLALGAPNELNKNQIAMKHLLTALCFGLFALTNIALAQCAANSTTLEQKHWACPTTQNLANNSSRV